MLFVSSPARNADILPLGSSSQQAKRHRSPVVDVVVVSDIEDSSDEGAAEAKARVRAKAKKVKVKADADNSDSSSDEDSLSWFATPTGMCFSHLISYTSRNSLSQFTLHTFTLESSLALA